CFDAELTFIAIAAQIDAVDVFERKPRKRIVGDTAIDQMGDIRMVEIGQDLPLGAEAPDHLGRIPAGPDQLDRYALLELAIDALGTPDRAHATAPDFLDQAKRADRATAKPLIGE